jgi:hypothetical protein
LYERVEKLVQAELLIFQRDLECNRYKTKKSDETHHREGDEVSEEVALASMRKWTRFVQQKPYDKIEF